MNIHQRSPWNKEDALFYRVDDDYTEPVKDIEALMIGNDINEHQHNENNSFYAGMLERNSVEATVTK